MVTGAGTGIGRATAIALAQAGLSVVLAGRRRAALEEVEATILRASGDARVALRPTDVGRPDECEALIAGAVDRFGRVDVVVTAAANFRPTHTLDLTPEIWDECLDVDLRGSVLVAVAAARRMKDTGGGRIVLISSINGHHSEPETAHYSAAKAGIISVARSMAVDLAHHGIAVNSVAPGWVETPMIADALDGVTAEELGRVNPLRRVGQPEEIADVITYLACRAPAFLTGATLFVDGGQVALAPVG